MHQSIANCECKGKQMLISVILLDVALAWPWLISWGQIDSSSLGVGEGSATEAGDRARSCGRYGAGTSDVS